MKKFLLIILVLIVANLQSQNNSLPFSTNDSMLTIWNGSEYIPFFMKGINLGVAIPGTFPGELAATSADYSRWFSQIKEIGFNCIRLYTLHYPRFYEVLDSFNNANSQNPLYFIQGVWLEEELQGYNNDLYFLNNAFSTEIEENIDCVHGNRIIEPRFGKAFGNYNVDASKWCMAYIIGREVYPIEVLTTNEQNPSYNSFSGNHFAIQNASPSEVWFTNMLNHTVNYQHTNYNTSRPVSNSSWPTLDPITHPEEPNIEEDTASIDLSKIQIINAPAGFFISYHAYPYYPDFISLQSDYQNYNDDYGPNSYLGYLIELKSHYTQYPLIIAEYGVPSSWAIAHYATSGMNHGGFDEYNQGLTNIRLLNTIRDAGTGGGIQFAWIDEWFKKTWITDPIDYIADSRILWHNIAAAEQNYGLLKYENTLAKDSLIILNPNNEITYLNSEVNYTYFQLELGLKNPLNLPDELWISFDTYAESLGELILPSGDTIPSRSEFALHITNYSAQLYVTEAYDIFGIWHNFSTDQQVYRSIPTDGAPWKIVRVRNNSSHSDVQYIGNLNVNYGFQPTSSKDAVIIHDDKIIVRIPWFYLNFVAPDQMKVFNDNRLTPEKEDTISDGIKISVLYNNNWYSHPNRYTWEPWVGINNNLISEKQKSSYNVMKNNLYAFNTPAIAYRDSFYFQGPYFPVHINKEEGLLNNDFDLDGDLMISLITQNPKNGKIFLNNDGSFEYLPDDGFIGYDSLQYCVYDGYTLSQPNTVIIFVEQNNSINNNLFSYNKGLILFPNPANENLNIKSTSKIEYIQIFNIAGQLIKHAEINYHKHIINISEYTNGQYIILAKTKDGILSERFVKQR